MFQTASQEKERNKIFFANRKSTLGDCVVFDAKIVCVNLLDLAVPQSAEVVSGRKKNKRGVAIKGTQTLRKQIVIDSKNSGKIPPKGTNYASRLRRQETFLQTFLTHHVKQFSVPTLHSSFSRTWMKIPNS